MRWHVTTAKDNAALPSSPGQQAQNDQVRLADRVAARDVQVTNPRALEDAAVVGVVLDRAIACQLSGDLYGPATASIIGSNRRIRYHGMDRRWKRKLGWQRRTPVAASPPA